MQQKRESGELADFISSAGMEKKWRSHHSRMLYQTQNKLCSFSQDSPHPGNAGTLLHYVMMMMMMSKPHEA